MNKWIGIPKDIKKYKGYVYIIIHLPTGRYYIGKKTFWFKKIRKPLKGRKNKRHYLVESDWKAYWGSSSNFNEFVRTHDKKDFERRILVLCENDFELSYTELLKQLEYNVLFDAMSFNEIINVRLRRRKEYVLEKEKART